MEAVTRATGRLIYKFVEEFTACNSSLVHDDGPVTMATVTGKPVLDLELEYPLEHLGTVHEGPTGLDRPFAFAFNAWLEARIEGDPRRASPHYPYTYADDMLRALGPHELRDGVLRLPRLTRPEAKALQQGLARALGIPDHVLAGKLADYYLEHEDELVPAQTVAPLKES